MVVRSCAFIALGLVLGLVVAACGGSGGDDDPLEPTPQSFDRNLLTGVGILPADVGPGFTLEAGFFGSYVDGSPAFNSLSNDGVSKVQSSVVHFYDLRRQDGELARYREVYVRSGYTESTLALDGADRAFFYRRGNLGTLAVLATRGPDLVYLQTTGFTSARDTRPEVVDVERIERLAALAIERLGVMQSDPSALALHPEAVTAVSTTSPDGGLPVTAEPEASPTP